MIAQLAINTIPLDLPIDANALNSARVTQRTVPVTLRLSGDHHEMISFHVIDCPSSPLVLGHPSLKPHNPQVDWSAGKVSSWSSFCHAVCILPYPQFAPEPPDLSAVPPVYYSLAPVFSKHNALLLPPHWPYDCTTDLQPGAPLPSSRLNSLSCPEQETMEDYIWD